METQFAENRLFNTREAATILKVSEASIRRWTDVRLLSCFRVGRNNDRRFMLKDILSVLRQF